MALCGCCPLLPSLPCPPPVSCPFHLPVCLFAWQVLDLSGCTAITEAAVTQLASACTGLQELSLCGCARAGTDPTLQSLAAHCPLLAVLNLGWCEALTDVGVGALATACVKLRVLDLCGCYNISDAAVVAIADKCVRLQGLGLHCCRRITDKSMHALARQGLAASYAGEHSMRLAGAALADEHAGVGEEESWTRRGHPTEGPTVLFSRPPLHPPGLVSLNISGCSNLSATAVQRVCDMFPGLHTCPGKRSLNTSGCTSLLAVQCKCLTRNRPSSVIVQ